MLNAGLYITADGVTIDGLEVTGAVQAGGTERAYGIVVGADNVTIKNSVLDGSVTAGSDTRPFGTVAGVENVSVAGNAIHDWAQGAYLTNGTTGSIDHNAFAHNGNGVVTESVDTVIAHNTFSDSAGAHVAPLPFVDADIGGFVYGNTFLDQDRPITVYANGPAGQTVTGSDVAEAFRLDYRTEAATVYGGGGDDKFIGGTGIDTAAYAAVLSASDISYDADTQVWTVTAGAAEGTDTLTNVEIVDGGGAGGSHILLVGGGGYATIQEAITAAQAGDTILIADGDYAENLTIDKEISLVAVNPGEVTINPAAGNVVTVSAGVNGGDVSISGINIDGANNGSGVYVMQHADVGTLTLDHVDIRNAGAHGVFVDGEDSLDAANAVTITNSTFANNGFNGTNGSAHIKLYGFDGDATLQNLTLDGAATGAAQDDRPDYGIELHGITNYKLGVMPAPHAGTVTIDNVTIAGAFHKNAVALNNYADVGGVSFTDVDLSGAQTNWGPVLNLDAIAGNIDASGFGITYPSALPANGFVADLQGDVPAQNGGGQAITGSSAAEHLRGGAGDDILTGGGGGDSVDGGAGNDTYVLSGVFSDYEIAHTAGNTYTITREGKTDTVVDVENIKFAGSNITADVVAHPDAVVTAEAPDIGAVIELGIDESAATGAPAATVVVSDANSLAGDQLTYTLVDGAGGAYTGPFSISAVGGGAAIKVAGPLDFESNPAGYQLTVKATDSTGNSTTQNVTIHVADANEAPTSISLSDSHVDENSPGEFVGEVSGTDPDSGDTLTFTVDDARFEIVTLGGQHFLKLKDGVELDSEATSNVALAITATDEDGLSRVQNFDVTVDHVNTLPPPGPLGTQNVSVKETAVAVPLDIEVPTDPDGDTLTFTANALPTLGSVLLNGHALTVGQTLTAAEVALLSYTAPITTTGTSGLQLSYTDGVGTQSLNVNITVTASETDVPNQSAYDFNGDQNADLFFTNSVNNGAAVWTLDGTHVTANPPIGTIPANYRYADQGDFGGNGKTDLLFINDTTHDIQLWQMDGTSIAASASVGTVDAAGGWDFAGAGDFSGDGKSDLLFINSANNGIAVWEMDGTMVTAASQVGTMDDGHHFAGLADFDGDGKTDVLTVNDATHDVNVRLMDGAQPTADATVGTINAAGGWHLTQSGDFNGDGKADLLFLNDTTHGVAVWEMDGTTVMSNPQVGIMNAAGGWHFEDVGDFNGDGKTDLLFLNDTTRGVAVWEMDGTTVMSNPQVGVMAAGQHFDRVADTNGDGKSDLVFVNDTTNAVTVWEMNGTQVADQQQIGTINAGGGWHLMA